MNYALTELLKVPVQDPTGGMAGRVREVAIDGTHCYAAVDAPDYLSLLTKALHRHRGEL